jgi:hypothetical protein
VRIYAIADNIKISSTTRKCAKNNLKLDVNRDVMSAPWAFSSQLKEVFIPFPQRN